MREREAFFREACQRKDKEYQDMAYVQVQLEEKETAIAKLKSELKARGEVKQLSFFPTPEEQAAVTPEPEPEETENDTTEVLQSEISLLDSVEGTVSASGLMEHIKDMKKRNRNFPDPPEKTQTFTDAATGKTKRLKELEEMYGFKLVGYVMKGSRREYRYKILDN